MLSPCNILKPILYIPEMAQSRKEEMYQGLKENTLWIGRCRALFMPAREIITEIISRPLTVIEAVALAAINLTKSSFSPEHCVKNSIFCLEKGVANALDTPLVILTAPLQYIHQAFSIAIDPKNANPAEHVSESFEAESFSKPWLNNLQDSLYHKPGTPYLNPLLARSISPLIALADVVIDSIAILAEAVENLFYNAIKQLLGSLNNQEGCSIKGALYYINQSRQGISNTVASIVMTPFKFVHQVFAICYDPKNASSIQNFLSTQQKAEALFPDTDSDWPYDEELQELSLKDFLEQEEQEREKIIESLEIKERIRIFERSDVLSELQNVNSNLLKNYTMEDLINYITYSERSKLHYIFLSNEKFSELTLQAVSKNNPTEDQMLSIKERADTQKVAFTLEGNSIQDISTIPFVKISSIKPEDLPEITKIPEEILPFLSSSQVTKIEARVRSMNADELKEALPLIPVAVLPFITTKQIKTLNLSVLSKDQLGSMFYYDQSDAMAKQRQAAHVAAINKDSLKKIISLLPENVLEFISAEQIKDLDLSPLLKEQLHSMFCYNQDDAIAKQRQAVRVAAIHKDSLKKIIFLLPENVLQFISAEQIKNLTLSELSEKTIHNIFPHYGLYDEEAKHRQTELIEAIGIDMLQTILPFLLLGTLKLISAELLKSLDLSTIREDSLKDSLSAMFYYDQADQVAKNSQAERIKFLKKDLLELILPSLTATTLQIISEEQIKDLKLSEISRENLYYMFNYYQRNEGEKERQQNRLNCIPDEHLKELYLAGNINPDLFNKLPQEKQELLTNQNKK